MNLIGSLSGYTSSMESAPITHIGLDTILRSRGDSGGSSTKLLELELRVILPAGPSLVWISTL